MWYDMNDLLSYNCVYNFIIGMRGGGKTFAFKEKAIKNFLKNKQQFIYLRRYKTELYRISTFFEPDLTSKFPDETFSVKGNRFYINGEVAGYAIALTKSMIEKSNNYANVTMIGFDEFILDSKSSYKYLQNEFDVFNNFYDTVDRNKDKTRVVFIGNAISEVNPYFSGLGITPVQSQRFTPFRKWIDGKQETLAVIEVWSDQEIVEKRNTTRFGKLMAGTDYESFSNANHFYRDNNSFIRKMSSGQYLFGIYLDGKILGVWQDKRYMDMYISREYKNRSIFCCNIEDMREANDLIPCQIKYVNFKESYLGRRLVTASRHQYLYYESQEVKNDFIRFSKYLKI